MGVAGNVLMLGMVHGICMVHSIVPVSVCLQILNFFSISAMDEATLFKFGKWVEYGRVHPRGEKFPLKGGLSGSHDPLKFFNPLNISGMDEATMFKFGK